MPNERSETEERIIKAALGIMGKQGVLKFTVRDIARQANVNLAAINYYFRSKENLFKEIEKYFDRSIIEINKTLDDADLEPMKRLVTWAKQYMKNLSDNPGIIWMLAYKVLKKEKIEKTMENFINITNKPLEKLLSEIMDDDEEIIKMKAIQILSGILYPLIIQYGVGKVYEIDFEDPSMREKHIESLISCIIPV